VVATDGTWSYLLTAANLATIGEGSGKTVIATATDAAGNTSDPTTSAPFGVDTMDPVVSGVMASPSDAIIRPGASVTFTLGLSDAVQVGTGAGTPTRMLTRLRGFAPLKRQFWLLGL
jgi:hypothetical protein